MSGRKHHHVPQFLQRRFGRAGRKSTTIFVFRSDVHVFPTNTENYGAERDFYADAGDFFVDDLITEYEEDIQPFLNKLLEGDPQALGDSQTIAEVVAHLEMRSAFLRSQMLETSGLMAEFLERTFSDRTSVKKMLAACLCDNPEMMQNAITQHFGSDAVSSALEQFVAPQIGTLLGSNLQPLLESFTDALLSVRSVFANSVKPAHLKSLSSRPADAARKDKYGSYSYRLQKFNDTPLILPDTMVAFSTKKGLTPFVQKSDELIEILLPLSSDTLLVGTKRPPMQRTGSEVNSLLASTSFGAFIAREDDPRLRRLAKKIGRNAVLLPEHDARRIFREVLAELTSRG